MNAQQIGESREWRHVLARLPGAPLLQSFEWGEFKSRYGWSPIRLAWAAGDDLPYGKSPAAAASVLQRGWPLQRLPGAPSGILYVPRGPVLDWRDRQLRGRVLGELERLARDRRAIFVKIDPEVRERDGDDAPDPLGAEVAADLSRRGWRRSAEQIQFRNTVRLDLTRPEEALLAAMKQKTRYNIRLSARKGVQVRAGGQADFDTLYQMYAATSLRDGFVIRPPQYYRDAWGAFIGAGIAQPFLAEVDGQPVAAILVFAHGGTATYLYGMSAEAHREKMPNHLLQWEAIGWARARGCTVYDFWGAPERFDPSDRLWGVWRFKEGFGGEVVRTLGAWDFVAAPLAYRAYSQLLPRLLSARRWLGRRQTQRELAG